jgi:hypothetical protein
MPSRTHLPEPLPSTEARTPLESLIGSEALALRVAVVPDGAPPYDCDAHGAGCPAAGTVPTGTDTVRPLAAPGQGPGAATAPASAVATAPASAVATTPAPGAGASAVLAASAVAAGATAGWPRQFAQVVVEILAGSRPARQIFPWTTDRARTQLRRLGSLVGCDRRPTIQRVVTSRPTAQVVEMTVVVNFGVRTRALAMRFEHVAGRQAAPGLPARPARWLCTEIEAG